MSTTRHSRPHRHRGNWPNRPPAADDVLGRLLAAAAPPRDYLHDNQGEFRGEATAVSAFREARLNPAYRPRRKAMSAGKLLAIKVAVAAVALSGGGGVALAATGHLAAQSSGHPAPSASSSSSAGTNASAVKGGSHSSATPSPSLQGLCHAYGAGVGSNPGKALENPAFTALITAAGGKDKVSSYCTTLLASSPSGNSAAHSGKSGSHSTGKPTDVPTSHPTGDPGTPSQATNKPTVAPTALPSAHPTGKPSVHPEAD
jgi:hypothetical protein